MRDCNKEWDDAAKTKLGRGIPVPKNSDKANGWVECLNVRRRIIRAQPSEGA